MGSGPPSPDAYGTDRRRPHRHRQLLADRRLNGTDPWDRRFLADRERTNMENFGVPPDIFVENTPEDNIAGRNRELEVAVPGLLKQLGQKTSTDASR
jgi:hypothetical protein